MARGSLPGFIEGDDSGEQVGEVRRREGSIVRIRMKDFITYDSVECIPGESLNVVIGPNGTGKSTILSAIVLGLGGKPVHLGKPQAQIQDFIKNHRHEAQIEIELLRQKRNTIIKRTISKDGKSIWHLNGRPVPMKDIDKETKALNIQIDNLCQVLAQDRVQDFAKLNKQELLEATQKAVGKEEMAKVHSTLKELQKVQETLEKEIIRTKKLRELEQGMVDRLKGVVERMQRRKDIELEADACRLKMALVNYKLKKDAVDRYKLMKKKDEEEVQRIRGLIEPFEQQIKQAEGKFKAMKRTQNDMDRNIGNQITIVTKARNNVESLREEILEMEVNFERQKKLIDNEKSKEDAVRQAISKLRNDITAVESLPAAEIETNCKKLEAEVDKLARLLNQTEPNKVQIVGEIEELEAEITNVRRELARLENVKELRMRTLQEVNRNAYDAARWVDSNRHMFKKPVHLPMMVELDVNPKYARYAENSIGYQDLVAIVCECKEDMKTVVDNCRKQLKLRVNVLLADPNCPPVEARIPIDQLRQTYPGFEGYLSDFVKGPDTLVNFLCHRKKFHNIPVSLGDVQASEVLSLYFSGDYKRGHKRSRYRSDLIYFSDPIGLSRFFKATTNDADENYLKARVVDLMKKIELNENKLMEVNQKINVIKQQREEARQKHQKMKQTQATIKTMKFHLSQKERDLAQMERGRLDPDRVKEQFKAKARQAVVKLVEAHQPFYQSLKQLDAFIVESQILDFEVQSAKAVVNSTKLLCKAEQDALQNAEAKVERINNALADERTAASNLANAVQRKHGKSVPVLWTENQQLFSTLPNTPEDLETHIEDKIAHAEMLEIGNDATTLEQFNTHVNKLEQLISTITEKEREAANLTNDMENRKNQWKVELHELVQTISTNFSRYFREMKCAGAVELYTGTSEHDYDNYGLRVRVKFRDNEELQDLNTHTQSGGERAVSTAIYMLALQELTPAPFRLVDEINQGMDNTNERRVYELILHSTSRPGTPQYFLLTPKLLKNMQYNSGTTVLCVMNSACAPNHKTWNMKKFIELRKKSSSNASNNNSLIHDVEMENESDYNDD